MFLSKTLRACALVLASASFLAACGGGDGVAANETLQTPLSGLQETTPVNTTASGSANLNFNRASGELSGTVQLSNITPTAAHIHMGAAGANGPVLLNLALTATGATLAPTVLTAAQITSLDAGELYVNVHSAANPGGELRGQIGREVYTAKLSGGQQNPAVSTSASGQGIVVLNPRTGLIDAKLTLIGMTATAAHIHTGALGTNGAVVVDMHTHTAGVYVGHPSTPLSAADIASLRAGNLYFNAHSAAHPSGEVRGQIGTANILAASATGAQEVPAVVTTGTGSGLLSFDPATLTLSGKLTLTGVNATAAHIHQGAVGVNGGVVVNLTETSAGSGVWAVPAATVLTLAQAQALLAGNMYFNAHTAANPSGEVRGQI